MLHTPPSSNWKQRIIDDYSILPEVFGDVIWDEYPFDFEGMHQ